MGEIGSKEMFYEKTTRLSPHAPFPHDECGILSVGSRAECSA